MATLSIPNTFFSNPAPAINTPSDATDDYWGNFTSSMVTDPSAAGETPAGSTFWGATTNNNSVTIFWLGGFFGVGQLDPSVTSVTRGDTVEYHH